MKSLTISIEDIDAIVFDFDGVLTNNIVHVDQKGQEYVSCSRAAGLAFDVLRKVKIPAYILSTEENPVVTARAKKLGISAVQGASNKVIAIKKLAESEGFDLKKTLYVGNDLNDYRVMQQCGYTACPCDSHDKVKSIATIVLKTLGGNGVARELLEDVLQLDFVQILYPT